MQQTPVTICRTTTGSLCTGEAGESLRGYLKTRLIQIMLSNYSLSILYMSKVWLLILCTYVSEPMQICLI